MHLNEIRKLIADSDHSDWNFISCWGSGTGPSYLYAWDKSTSADGWELHHAAHSRVLVYRKNVSLSVASGMPDEVSERHGHGLEPDWISNFADDSPVTIQWTDILWNGNLVDRFAMTAVDGGRALLPWPDAVYGEEDENRRRSVDRWEVTRFHAALARILDETSGAVSEFDRYLGMAGITVVDRLSRDH